MDGNMGPNFISAVK